MGRSVSGGVTIVLLLLTTGLAGCGGGSTPPATFPIPAKVTLTPATSTSLDVGLTMAFTASTQSNKGQNLTDPVFFQSSNTSVLTIASNGLACAGSWDSLSNPQICTPGPVGMADITAMSQGVSSTPTRVFVHQHIQNIQVNPVTTPPTACFSRDQTFNYAATAFGLGPNNSLVDITSTVGAFSWQSLNLNVVELSNTVTGLLSNQAQATARIPGMTSVFASAGGANSSPLIFSTCSVQSITLAITGSSDNSFSIATGSKSITATVVDTLGNTITEIPLTWSSSEPGAITVTSTGLATAVRSGTSTIIASCTPPTCNAGILPTLPIYPTGVINATVTGTPSTTTLYVATTGCLQNNQPVDGCTSTLVPVTGDLVGTGLTLPATPNSLVFSRDGAKAFLGTELSLLGSKGLVVFTPSTNPPLTMITAVTGKVLAISPDGKKVIVSHTNSTEPPNQVFVFDTTTSTSVAFPIAGVTAADFSPDSLKAYLIAGSTLYVYSTLDALKAIPLAAAANDVTFLSEGAFAYVAGGDPAGVSVWTTCTNVQADSVNDTAAPQFIKTLPDATQVVAVKSPGNGVDLIRVTTAPTGCPPAVIDSPATSFDFGQGSFTPNQLIIAPDGSKAYVLTSNLGSVLVFNVGGQTSSSIAISGNAIPVRASLSVDGTLLYVAANDGLVHVLDTVAGGDIHQIAFPQDFCSVDTITCNPDLIAVQP